MNVSKLSIKNSATIPLMAALPYEVVVERQTKAAIVYDPINQLTQFGGRDFSTCRMDESVNPLFGKSKSDTQKDD